jgi:peptidoglycan/LPS O-acetylase OafA/YrhL
MVTPFFYHNFCGPDNFNFNNYLLHLFLLQEFKSAWIHTLLDGSWTIICEAMFYILYPLVLVRLAHKPVRLLYALAASILFSVIFAYLVGKNGVVAYYLFPAHLPVFLIGILAYRIREHLPKITVSVPILVGSVVCGLSLFVCYGKASGGYLGVQVAYSLVFAGFLIGIPDGQPGPVRRLLEALGRETYSLFLVHILVLKIGYTLLLAPHPELGFSGALGVNLLLGLPLTWALSHWIFNPIDRKCVELVGQWLRPRRVPSYII